MVVLWKLLLLVLLRNDIVIKSQQACLFPEYYTAQGVHRLSHRTFIEYRSRSTLKCCSGYSGIYPDCEKICDFGYQLRNGDCEPICGAGCSEGSCIEPHICDQCDLGFERSYNHYDGDCEPTCSMECENGFCSAPDECSCDSGYEMNDFNLCQAVCDEGCFNGDCVGPNECQCYDGFELRNKDCHPRCEVPCEHGFCSSPYQCVCLEGYTMNSRDQCKPICPDGCLPNQCSTPHDCLECAEGYHQLINEEGMMYCKAMCDNCGFGNCIPPGVCVCLPGYYMNDSGSCNLPSTKITTMHPEIGSSTSMIPELSISTETSLTETETDTLVADFSTFKSFKDDIISNMISTAKKPKEALEVLEVLDNISPHKPKSTRNWMPWIIVVVAALLIVILAIGKSMLIRNKRFKARCNSQFLVTFDNENKNVDCVLCEN